MTGAIFGLVGVIVGSLLAASVDAFREWRSQRTLSRAAARLLSAELSVQQDILQRRVDDASTQPPSDDMPAVADWPDQRVVMAKMLDDKTWVKVAGAYSNLVVWHAQSSRTAATEDLERQQMEALAYELQAARDALHDFRFGPPEPESAQRAEVSERA
jgi:hypothetical protein